MQRIQRLGQVLCSGAAGERLGENLLLADLQYVQASGQCGVQCRASEIGDDLDPVAAQIARQPAVDLAVKDGGGIHSGQQRDARVQRRAERQPVELVGLVAGEALGFGARDLLAHAVTASVDVDAVGRGAFHARELDVLPCDQPAQDRARLAAQGAAQTDLGAEQRGHAGHPEALSAGVQMNLLPGGVRRLDGDRQKRRGREHHKRRATHPRVIQPQLVGAAERRDLVIMRIAGAIRPRSAP